MSEGWDLFADVAAITAWLDTSNEASPHEDSMRVLKLVEEAGEAAAAYIGMVGQNPRKGVTHSQADLLAELADVALTALCAMQHFTQDAEATRGVLAGKVAGIMARADIGSGTPPSHLHFADPEHGSRGACGATAKLRGGGAFRVAFDPGDERIDCTACRTWLADRQHTPDEWCARYGMLIADHDGWRGPRAPSWTTPIGLREFYARACESTTNGMVTGAFDRIAWDLALLPQNAASTVKAGR